MSASNLIQVLEFIGCWTVASVLYKAFRGVFACAVEAHTQQTNNRLNEIATEVGLQRVKLETLQSRIDDLSKAVIYD